MKIFISWSGDISKEVALALHDVLPAATGAETFMSDQSIQTGTAWLARLEEELGGTNFGIVCLTPDNLTAPWIHYEAGAIGKLVQSGAKLTPYLFKVERSQVSGGLAGFNNCRASERDDLKKLFSSINEASSSATLTTGQLDLLADTWWPKLSERLAKIDVGPQEKTASKRSTNDLLEEILALVRKNDASPAAKKVLDPNAVGHFPLPWSERLAIVHAWNALLKARAMGSLSDEETSAFKKLGRAIVDGLTIERPDAEPDDE